MSRENENRCPNCGGRMRLVNVTRINKFQAPEASLYDSSVTRRKTLLGNLPKLTTQEMMCVCCGHRIPFTGKITARVKKAASAKSVKPNNNQKKNVQKSSKPQKPTNVKKIVIVFLIKFAIFLAALAVLAYFAYQYKDVFLGYLETAKGMVGKLERLVEKVRGLVEKFK